MTTLENGQQILELKEDDILCRQGDQNTDLYIIQKGRLLVCINEGRKITPLAYLDKGEYVGELSFFDGKPRSTHVVAVKPTTLICIPSQEAKKQFPSWLYTIAKNISRRIRATDHLVAHKGLKKTNSLSLNPLSIEQERHLYELIFSSKS